MELHAKSTASAISAVPGAELASFLAGVSRAWGKVRRRTLVTNRLTANDLPGSLARASALALGVPFVQAHGAHTMSAAHRDQDPTFEPRIGRSVSLDHAAQLLGVSRRTIYNRIRDGRLQTIRTAGGSQRVLLDSVSVVEPPLRAIAQAAGRWSPS